MRLGLPWRSEETRPPPPGRASSRQRSLALDHVLGRLAEAPRPGVLDLGSPVASNLELYRRHRARIAFADLYRFYDPARARYASASGFDELVPPSASHTDIIFAWDLLNYLSPEEIGWLGSCAGERCAPGAILFALVACSGDMPAAPSHYAIVDSGTLQTEPTTTTRMPSPSYSEQSLLRSLVGWNVKSRFQLRNAMVEYVLTWE